MTVYLSRPRTERGRRVYRITADTRWELEQARRRYVARMSGTATAPYIVITDYQRRHNTLCESDFSEDDPARWKKITL